MAENKKLEFELEGLACASCAEKIQDRIQKIDGVKSAFVGFATQKMRIEIDPLADGRAIAGKARKIAVEIESGIRLIEIRSSGQNATVKSVNAGNVGNAGSVRNIGNAEKSGDSEKKENGDKDGSRDFSPGEMDGSSCPIEKKSLMSRQTLDLLRFAASLLLLATGLLWRDAEWIRIVLYGVSYLLIGGDVVFGAFRNILHGQVFDEKFLMTIATVGAFAIKEFPEAVSVMLFYQVGEFVQGLAVRKSRKSIAGLLGIRPDCAYIKKEGELRKMKPEEIHIGDIIWVRPGERIPIDGHIVSGEACMDLSALTGESLPRNVVPGDLVLSGSINITGMLEIQTDKEFGESTVSKILEIVENANSRKAPIEHFITKFSKIYTPIVVGAALLLAVVPPLVVPGALFSDWLYRALVFLVVSCPCALVISIPLGFFGGIGGASKNGILVKGGNYLEALNDVDTVVFDKTGTLTKGAFAVTKIVNLEDENDTDSVLRYAAIAEAPSNHPIAHSIRQAYTKLLAGQPPTGSCPLPAKTVNTCELPGSARRQNADALGNTINTDVNIETEAKLITNESISTDEILPVESYEELSGAGIRMVQDGKEILIGNTKLMEMQRIAFPQEILQEMGTLIHVVRDKVYIGYLLICDEVKEDAKRAIEGLKKLGIGRIVMLTGDRKSVGESIGRHLSIDEVYTDLLPVQKVERLEIIETEKKTKGALLFVGDGINDAPVLARADVGFAMGGIGSDAAIEAADVIIMTDEPSKVVQAIQIAKRTKRIVWQNIVLALAVKGIVLLLGAGGIATMWEAVFADVGVAVLAVLNSTRAMRGAARNPERD